MSPPPSVSSAVDRLPIAKSLPVISTTRGGALAKDSTLGALGLAVLATVFFSMGDVTAKVLTGTLPAIEVAWLRYIVLCLVVAPIAFVVRGPKAMHTPCLRLQIIRALAEAGSTVLF